MEFSHALLCLLNFTSPAIHQDQPACQPRAAEAQKVENRKPEIFDLDRIEREVGRTGSSSVVTATSND